jgi:glycosyltransferase involved in cell wall biosynthesis
MKKVSVVVPTFNQARYLPVALDHVLQQDYPEMEVIVVDGGSTDGTPEVLEKYVRETLHETVRWADRCDGEVLFRTTPRFETPRDLEIVRFDHDIGATETYNEGFRRATGDFVTYVVADDIPHVGMVRRLAETLEGGDVDFAYADMQVVDDGGRILRVIRKPDYSFERCFADWFHLGVARLYRREWHDRAGLFDPAYRSANDYDMYLRMAMAGCTFRHVPEVLYSVRHHGEDRRTGQHDPAANRRLFEESMRCAHRAREWMAKTRA